jgi:hypothetical protein
LERRATKEHSGGSPRIGLIPIQANGETFFELTPIFEWNPESIDSLLDILAEHQARAGTKIDLAEMILRGGIREIELTVSIVVWKTLAAIKGAKDSRMAADQIAWVSGMAGMTGQSLGELARNYGLSKQAFQQGAEQYRFLFPTIRSQSARSTEARENMSQRNFRRNGHHAA